ncbi:MAG: ElyC/SanA/YdcF family protein [Minisyncoccia bacterium]|jgi:hypothetical protein
MILIIPLTKSPHFTGRYGPVEWQDWYRGLVKAKTLLELYKAQGVPAKILVLSAVQVTSEKSEVEIYTWALKKLGVDDGDIMVINKTQETIEQTEMVAMFIKKGIQVVIISTWLHYLRVRWLCRGLKAKHYIVWGIPRPREAITDIMLTVLFPPIDLCGGREWFLKKTRERRLAGKF